jgi:N-acetylneuraminic acid mutarotase
MPPERIEEKVRDNLRSSRVLDDYWRQPIRPQQLQAEMERMARRTKNPEMLSELFEALGNDPFVIAECLVRPALSERLANEFYGTNATPSSEAKPRAAAASESAFTGYFLPPLTSTAGVCADNTWSALTDVPGRRGAHTAVWTGSELIVWGGFNYDEEVGTGERYNPATDTWSKVTMANAPMARYGHTAVWSGTEMIVWGGYQLGGISLSNGGKYDPANDSWMATSLSNAPTPRYAHTAVWTGSMMFVWGGIDGTQTDPVAAYSNTGGLYDPKTDTWTAVNNANAPPGRVHHSVIWTGSEMVLWGGQNYHGFLNNGARYNPTSGIWTSTNPGNAPGPRYSHSAVWTGTEMIIWGGWNYTALSDGATYNPVTNSWVALNAANPPQGRFSHSAIWTGSQMIVWGGNADGQTSSGARYNPSTNTWAPTSLTNAPSPRDTHTTIWTGNEMIVFGGGYDETYNNGGRYDPISDTWTPVRTTHTPDGRAKHTAVWTGSEMIVWGGVDNYATRFSSGGRYDPALDTWTPTSTLNAPIGRQDHAAVWTGTEMIIWGGWYSTNTIQISNTGGRYDPAANSWTPTSLINAPDHRREHSCVWTGTEMIVWGGNSDIPGNASNLVNTGGRYNPNTDTWVATSTTNAPSARNFHSAVWNGSEMIVWGGGYYAPGNTGARYNPSTDSWIPTSTIGTPPRAGHSAIWTGKEMIVWSGYNGSIHINTGARYTPATDTWSPTSLSNAPDGRGAHATVWTGDEMIVWGGFNSQQNRFLDSGGRYSPAFDTWSAMTTINAPHAVDFPTAVWTGSRMIVFGGFFTF